METTRVRRLRLVIPLLCIALMAIVVGVVLAVVVNRSEEPTRAEIGNEITQGAQANPSAMDDRKLDVPQAEEYNRTTAKQTREQYPSHYKCRDYPADPALAELVPTANVNMVARWNPITKTYDIAADKRIIHAVRTYTEPRTSETGKTSSTRMEVSWTYRLGAEHFSVFSQRADGRWQVYGDELKGHEGRVMRLDVTDGAREPLVVVMATDPSTCDPGVVPLPNEINWKQLGDSGLLTPAAQ